MTATANEIELHLLYQSLDSSILIYFPIDCSFTLMLNDSYCVSCVWLIAGNMKLEDWKIYGPKYKSQIYCKQLKLCRFFR